MKSVFDVFDRQQQSAGEGGERQLDHEELVRSALLEAEDKNALIVADLLAISRASIDGFNQALAEEALDPAQMEHADIDQFNRAVAEQILDQTTERPSQNEASSAAPAAETLGPNAAPADTVARVITKEQVRLAA